MQEENDMPAVTPDGHELVGSYEKLEMSDKEELARMKRIDDLTQHATRTLDEHMKTMSSSDTFCTSMVSNVDDRRTLTQVQGMVLQHIGMQRDVINDLLRAYQEVHVSNRQLLRNVAGIAVLGINTYMLLEVPEQDLRAPQHLAGIDLLNPVLPRDTRLYEHRNIPRAADAGVPNFANNNREDIRFDPNGGLQLANV